jgi:lipopolysaccharide biosynthesis protein
MLPKTAIILWLYHNDLWPEFYRLLKPIKEDIVLYVGLCKENNNNDIIKILNSNFNIGNISQYENAGADVRPFLHQLPMVTEPIFIKIHSKKSKLGAKKHIAWRSVLINSVLGSKKIFDQTVDSLTNNPEAGSVCNQQLILSNMEGVHSEKIQYICKLLQINYETLTRRQFAAGNIFASRTDLYLKYFNCINQEIEAMLLMEKNKVHDFYNQLKGTASHSLERVFGYINEYNNKKIIGNNICDFKIINSKSPTGYFSLIINYDLSCYISEELNIFGKVLTIDSNCLLIEWLHMPVPTKQSYKFIDQYTIIKNEN